ncbi:MAG: hypothetical protein U0235_10695 [Polyangiaceae bacterium]
MSAAGTDDVDVWHARVAERVGKDYQRVPAIDVAPVTEEAR